MNGSKINNSRPGRTLFGCEHEQHKRRTLGAVVIIRHVQGVLQFTTNSLASDDSVPLELYKRGIAGVTPGQGLLLRQPTSTPDVRRAEASGTTDSMKESRLSTTPSGFCRKIWVAKIKHPSSRILACLVDGIKQHFEDPLPNTP
ncbi:hypothetical protein PGT21_000052, partial [Puccinia graminis f. sp. tritici]